MQANALPGRCKLLSRFAKYLFPAEAGSSTIKPSLASCVTPRAVQLTEAVLLCRLNLY